MLKSSVFVQFNDVQLSSASGDTPAHRGCARTILAASLLALSQIAVAQGSNATTRIPPRPEPFKTTPHALVEQVEQAQVQSQILDTRKIVAPIMEATNILKEQQAEPVDAPWVLDMDQKPWPLRYSEPSLPTQLSLDAPSAGELKLRLPGQVSDVIEQNRFLIEKYIKNNQGTSIQDRKRQLERVLDWAGTVIQQKGTLPAAEWPQYQFAKSVHEIVEGYRENILKQSRPAVELFATEAQNAVTLLSKLMPVMPTHAMQKATYKIMARMQEGVELFQSSLEQDDARILSALNEVLLVVPRQALPADPPPHKELAPYGGGWVPEPVPSTPTKSLQPIRLSNQSMDTDTQVHIRNHSSSTIAVPSTRTMSQNKVGSNENSGSSLLGYLILAIAGFGLFGMAKKLRKKKYR